VIFEVLAALIMEKGPGSEFLRGITEKYEYIGTDSHIYLDAFVRGPAVTHDDTRRRGRRSGNRLRITSAV